MGADLIMNALALRPGLSEPDWDAGRNFVHNNNPPKVTDYDLDMVWNLADGEDLTRSDLRRLLIELEQAFDGREVDWIQVGDFRVYLTGGMSWGGEPTDSFALFQKFQSVPGLMKACGFLDEEAPQSPEQVHQELDDLEVAIDQLNNDSAHQIHLLRDIVTRATGILRRVGYRVMEID